MIMVKMQTIFPSRSWYKEDSCDYEKKTIISKLDDKRLIDDYAKDSGPGVVRLLCSFYREPLRSLIVKEVQLLCHLISLWLQIENRDSVKPFEVNL